MRVVVLAKICQLSFQITGIPEKSLVKEFSTNGADQTFDEGMRQRHVGNVFDLLNFKDAQIRLPAVEREAEGALVHLGEWQLAFDL